MTKFNTIQDAETALTNSGVLEWFDYDQLEEVAQWMYMNDKSADEAAEHFCAK